MTSSLQADAKHVRRHLVMLADTIGVRYSGTEGEQRAADYVERQYKRYGLTNVQQQAFEFPNWDYQKCDLRIGPKGRLKRVVGAFPKTFSISTPPRGLSGPIVYLGNGTDFDFRRAGSIKGKIGLIIGALELDSNAVQNHLKRSGLLGLMLCDDRVPYDWRISVGGAAHSADGIPLPTMAVPFMEAVRIAKQLMHRPMHARLVIKARAFAAMSHNVIGEIRGTRRPEQTIVISGHHDSVMHVVGANDNATGVAFVLELARLFAKRRPKRTLRFVSYGVEEKLSVGAYLYMRSLSKAEQHRIVLGINADAIGAVTGTDAARITGNKALLRVVRDHWRSEQHPADITEKVFPYSDHFALNVAGVPTFYVSRPDILGGSFWTLHSKHDNMDNVDPAVVARTTTTVARLMHRLANADRLPFARKIEPAVQRQINAVARDHMNHPWSAKDFDYSRYD